MDKEALIQKYKGIAPLLRCPLCGKRGRIAGFGGFLCEKKHTFDLSAQGYLNFAPRQPQEKQKYGRGLFESRRAVLEGGFYQPVAEELLALAAEYLSAGAPRLLDAGCGEGYYTAALAGALGPECAAIGADLSRDAIRMAARRQSPARWLIADLRSLPLANQSIALLLNILTPADYREFSRVLTRDGLLLKAVPGPDYLREIRALLPGEAPSQAREEGSQVSAHFARHMRLLDRRRVRRVYPLTPAQSANFLAMSPLTFGGDIASLPPDALTEITIDLELLAGRRKR